MHRIVQAQQPRMLPASQAQLRLYSNGTYPPGYLAQLAQSAGSADVFPEYLLEGYGDEYLPLIQEQAGYPTPHPQVQQYDQLRQYAQPPYSQRQRQPPTHLSQLAVQQMLDPQIANLIAQMQQQPDGLARGLGQSQQYAYTDQAGGQVRGTVSTQAWVVPMAQVTALAASQPQLHPEKPTEGHSVSIQMAGMIAMAVGLLIMLIMVSLSLSHSQGVNDGLGRANTTVHP